MSINKKRKGTNRFQVKIFNKRIEKDIRGNRCRIGNSNMVACWSTGQLSIDGKKKLNGFSLVDTVVLPYQPLEHPGGDVAKNIGNFFSPNFLTSGPRSSAIYPSTIATRNQTPSSAVLWRSGSSRIRGNFCQYFVRMFTCFDRWVCLRYINGSYVVAKFARCLARWR